MHVVYGYDHVPHEARGATLAIGNFDGVHRGHQALFEAARRAVSEHGGLAGAMVFEPHPREFFQPDKPHFRLTTLPQKIALFERYGVDLAVVLTFDRHLARLTAREFIERVLVAGLGVRRVIVGHDFHFGKGRDGNTQVLQRFAEEMGFEVTVIETVAEAGEVFSSSAIRAEIAQGDVKSAADALGHNWRVAGKVVGGAKRGTGLGYPTANIPMPLIALSVRAPPLGVCSATTPSIVGQKNVLPKPYSVAAMKIIAPAALDSMKSPAMASTELTVRRPSGESLWTIGPAKKRRTIMMSEV